MRTPTKLLSLSFFLFVVACATASYRFERDPQVPLAPGATWAWSGVERTADVHAAEGPATSAPLSSITRSRLETAIANELASKGYVSAERERADLLVDYYVTVVEHSDLVAHQEPAIGVAIRVPVVRCGPPGCWRTYIYDPFYPGAIVYRERRWREGVLIVDFTDRSSGKLAARAVGRDEIGAQPVSDQKLRDGVERMLRDLAPAR